MSEIPFEKIRDTVVEEIVGVTNAYVLLTDFAFPIGRQGLLSAHYPFLVGTLTDAFQAYVLLGTCRLFDPRPDRRNATLSHFLRRVVAYHAADKDVKPKARARRKRYESHINKYLDDIKGRWRPLVGHRNAYLVHRDLTQTPPDMTYKFLRQCFEQAQKVVAGYYAAYRDTARLFDLPGVRADSARLLVWCRFDDYERHFNEDMERWEKKFRKENR